MSDPKTDDTVIRFHKRVRYVQPGYLGITLGTTEHVMQEWEAVMLSSMIDDVIEDKGGDITNG